MQPLPHPFKGMCRISPFLLLETVNILCSKSTSAQVNEYCSPRRNPVFSAKSSSAKVMGILFLYDGSQSRLLVRLKPAHSSVVFPTLANQSRGICLHLLRDAAVVSLDSFEAVLFTSCVNLNSISTLPRSRSWVIRDVASLIMATVIPKVSPAKRQTSFPVT